MYQVIIVIHVLLGLGVIGLVLMQQGKGADAGAAFGTGSAGSVFGAQGAASFLSRSTAILATLFFATSLGLAVANGHRGTEQDIMSAPATTESGLPAVEGAKNVQDVPPVATPNAKETDALPPVLPTPAGQAPVDTSVKAVETPKAETKPTEEVKPVEASKPVEATKPAETKPVETAKPVEHKPVVKEHKQAAKDDKKAETHKGKDAKKDH